ncbi:uncharacterized protein LOC131081104 [Melospiza georgiana]|uniref:uncharacterized protein LOC131081104 n=1 Tax=Melospiza georgiana TaxID=44398 RepID=UPI0025AD42FA|nr:uncharacterized protein LOC131081104 [Melospiza georgiana]
MGPRRPSPTALRSATSPPACGAPFTAGSAAVFVTRRCPHAAELRALPPVPAPRSPLPVRQRRPPGGTDPPEETPRSPEVSSSGAAQPFPSHLARLSAVPQKLCFTESRQRDPAALPQRPARAPALPRHSPRRRRDGGRGGAHGRFPHPLPPHTRTLLPGGKRLLPAQEWPEAPSSPVSHCPPQPSLLPREVPASPGSDHFPRSSSPVQGHSRVLHAQFCAPY